MASFRKLANGNVQATVYVGRDTDGTQIREYVTCASKKDCKEAVREIEADIANGNYSQMGRVRLVDWVEKWIELNRKILSPGTILIYKINLEAHYRPFFGEKKMKDITEVMVREFMALKLETLNPNTVRKLVSVLNKMLREALRDKNPARFIKLPDKKDFTPYNVTDEDFERIHTIVIGTIDEIFVLLSAWCGLRLGEICALKPGDILKKQCKITIDESLTKNDKHDHEYKSPKSKNGVRTIDISEYLMGLIQAYMKEKGSISEKLFDYLPGSYTHRWIKIVTDNKLPHIRFHDLRHYHISDMYDQGIKDKYAAKRAGDNPETIRKIYQHLRESREDEMSNAFRNVRPGKKLELVPVKEEKKPDQA